MIMFFQPCLNIHSYHLYTCRDSLGPCHPLLLANAILEDSEKHLTRVRGASTPMAMDSTQAGHPAHAESTGLGLASWTDFGDWDGLGAERMQGKHPGCGVKRGVSRWRQRAESHHSTERANCGDRRREEEVGRRNLFLKVSQFTVQTSWAPALGFHLPKPVCPSCCRFHPPTSHVVQLLPLTSIWTQQRVFTSHWSG